MAPHNSIPVIDLFAGPGGLGEGFSSVSEGPARFKIGLSIEKDPVAHQTLVLRAFTRQFTGRLPDEYFSRIRGEISQADLFALFPAQARAAAEEAVCLELDAETAGIARRLVAARVERGGRWVLIGGPPCQAYSLVGRARNKGVRGYTPSEDPRQTLYVEYLQILADHAPAVFVMENVKGLLSASVDNRRIFDRILSDLRNPSLAIRDEHGRGRARADATYRVYSIVEPTYENDPGLLSPSDFVVRSERYGVPQARHRVILVGVREGFAGAPQTLRPKRRLVTVEEALSGLPKIRSGLSDQPDDAAAWARLVRSFASTQWARRYPDRDVRSAIRTASDLVHSRNRGGEFLPTRRTGQNHGNGVYNHMSRAHIASDLARYFFASCFAMVHGKSPAMRDFPRDLLPAHENVELAVQGGHFADRFRVQVAERPSTTVTSHISKDGHYYIHPDPSQCRSLSVREAARLQTFPDDYFFCGPRTAQFHQVGNAVPPFLASQIARSIADLMSE